ncbi:unnamed protein product, partial [Ectocarpus sp. 12 AP-2014]
MVSSRQLLSLALALCSCHASSAFAGVVTTRGGGLTSPAATPPRAIDGVEQQLGVVRRARGGALLRRRGVAVPAPDQGGLVVESGDKNGGDGLLASYLRALDTKPLITKVITSGVICGIGDIMAQALAFKTAATESFSLGSFLAALEFKRLAIYGETCLRVLPRMGIFSRLFSFCLGSSGGGRFTDSSTYGGVEKGERRSMHHEMTANHKMAHVYVVVAPF